METAKLFLQYPNNDIDLVRRVVFKLNNEQLLFPL